MDKAAGEGDCNTEHHKERQRPQGGGSAEAVHTRLMTGLNGTPMAAWGTPGGGPLTPQQIDNIIAFLEGKPVHVVNPGVLS